MKQKIIIIALNLILSINIQAQFITPITSNVYCPNTTITFAVTLPGTNNTSISVFGWATNVAPYTNGIISNLVIDNTNNITTFNFNGNFLDFNNSQTFRVQYYISGQQHYTEFTYTKIKSFQTTVSESIPLLTPNSITANRCQIQNFNISFNNVQFANPWVDPKQVYGTEAGYEYLLPVGWVLNGTTSTGSNWITGANNVTVTSDLSHGNGENIQIRAVNSCGTN